MTREEMAVEIEMACDKRSGCAGCALYEPNILGCYQEDLTDEEIEANYYKMFPPKKENVPKIKDSGERTTFYDENGNALGQRDMQEDKGACELMPLDVVAEMMPNAEAKYILRHIERFKETGDHEYLYGAIKTFIEWRGWDIDECLFEVSLHYKQGKEKYGAYNWQKGIPVSSFVSSGVRHLIKAVFNWEDEPHDRAFVWNMFGAIWTMVHKPEMIDIPFDLIGGK